MEAHEKKVDPTPAPEPNPPSKEIPPEKIEAQEKEKDPGPAPEPDPPRDVSQIPQQGKHEKRTGPKLRYLLMLSIALSLTCPMQTIVHSQIESSFELSHIVIQGKEFRIKPLLQLGDTVKTSYREKMGKSCKRTGGTCPYWSVQSVAARQMGSLLNSDMGELTNFCSGSHPNTQDSIKLGALIDMKHSIPGVRNIASMLKFQKGIIPGAEELFQAFDPEDKKNANFSKTSVSRRGLPEVYWHHKDTTSWSMNL